MKIGPKEIFSIPNAVSTTGLGLVYDGSKKIDEPLGLLEVMAGRWMDLIDGPIARHTGQTSEFGATVDASFDKLGGLAILAAEWRKDVAPKPALAAIFAQNLINGIATVAAAKTHPSEDLRPSRAGKYAMFSQNIALSAYASSKLLRRAQPKTAETLRNAGNLATVVGVGIFGVKATYDYIKRARA